MSYVKKGYYSKPQISLLNCDIDEENNAYIRQSGSMMTVNNNQIRESFLNVEDLYKTDVMKK